MKIFWFVIVLLLAYALVTRFVYFETQETAGPVASYPCFNQPEERGEHTCQDLAEIKVNYQSEIQPIFEQKCLMCHGVATRLPLYAKLPPAIWLINHDRKEAKEELNMSWGFPFRGELGERSQTKALEEIAEVVEENSMPPWVYRIMHWKSSLTEEEKAKILNWVKESKVVLEKGRGDS